MSKEKKKNHATNTFLKPAYNQLHTHKDGYFQEKRKYGYRGDEESKLKKKRAPMKNQFFREIQEPMDYETLQKRFTKVWN